MGKKFAALAMIMTHVLASIKKAFAPTNGKNISERISNGRQAFYAVSAPHRANQRKNYRKAWG